MFDLTSLTAAVPLTAPVQVRANGPPPEQRTVEHVAESRLQQQSTHSQFAPTTNLDDLIHSARQFAEILDSTHSVQVASSISGFRVGSLDVYG